MRLAAHELGAERGGERIFSNLSFRVAAGEALLVTGPNGAGKSTLLQVLCDLLPLSEGKVVIEDGGEAWPTVAAAAHYLGHQNAMKPGLSVFENLDFWRRFNGEPRMDVDEALEAVGLVGLPHLPYSTLSTGQRRRAAIARLLVSFRPIWLLDEPTAGLDARSERRFTEIMEAHREEGGIIVAATHWPLGLADVQELVMGGVA